MKSITSKKMLAEQLIKTALNETYDGDALYQASQMSFLSEEDVNCLKGWLNGVNRSTDHLRLQDIAHKIMEHSK
jgi:hypothetical protein